MATAAAAPRVAPSIVTTTPFRLADRIKIQQEHIRTKRYKIIGKLATIVWERQASTSGYSQSRARWDNAKQATLMKDQPGLHPFSEWQAKNWAAITLDWLNPTNAPPIAISADFQDLILPFGMTPLPAIPDPRWIGKHAQQACPNSKKGCAGCIPPRIPQLLTKCPVVGDRVKDMIKGRDGSLYGVIHPILELCVIVGGSKGSFARIKGATGVDGTKLSLLIDDTNPDQLEGYFVGGRFSLGG